MQPANKKSRIQRYVILSAAALCALLIFSGSACADRVAVIISQPDGGTYQKCISVARLANAYDVLEETGKDITWSSPGPWGHGLCAIGDTGCEAKNCFCDQVNSWRFYVKQWSSESWTMSMKSFDGGSNCEEHYCAQDGDVIGFAYGPDGTEPASFVYDDICEPVSRSTDSDDEEDEETTTTRKTTTTAAPQTTTQPPETTAPEETTTTEKETTTTLKPTTTTKVTTTSTTEPAPTTTHAATTAPTTTLAQESPNIIGDVISYSLKNPPMVAVFAAFLTAAYIGYDIYKKKVRTKNA
jgi:hypothetical protein